MIFTLNEYQMAADEEAGKLTPAAALQNLMTASAALLPYVLSAEAGTLGEADEEAMTGPLDETRREAMTVLGAALFNVAVLARRLDIGLNRVGEFNLERIRYASQSGKLRAIQGK